MQHIGQLISDSLKEENANFDVSYFRSRIPELDRYQISDSFIQRYRATLWEYLRQAEICAACTGYATCGKQGDMQGFIQELEPYKGSLSVQVRRCEPFLAFMARKRVDRYVSLAGMMELDQMFQFENYPTEQSRQHPELMRHAKQFAKSYDPTEKQSYETALRGIYLFGPPGVGKTHLMFAVFNQLRERDVACLVVRSDSLFDRMRHLLADGQDLEPFLETLATVPVLGLDEFAQERANDFTMEKLFRIVNHRFHSNLPTWFTSNYSPPDIYRKRGEDISDTAAPLRSRVMAMCKLAKLDGPDARQRNLEPLR